MNVGEAIRDATARLAATSDTARLDAELLMAHTLGVPRSHMLLNAMREPTPQLFGRLVERRSRSEPIAYILGKQEFYGRDFAVEPGVLIPRGDSETLIAAAREFAPGARRVLDLGTGSGALLITAVLELDDATGIGIDASTTAIRVANANAQNLGLTEATARFLLRDWNEPGWTDRLGRFDLVLCNPPYVEADAALDPDVREFEPAKALFSGPEGLDDYRRLLPELGKLLSDGAVAIFEIGARQTDAVSEIARNCGFVVERRHDLANRPRALIFRT